MLSRPLALGIVAVACVAAAGAGAYVATLQHARSDTAMAAGRGAPDAAVQAQEPVAQPAPNPQTPPEPLQAIPAPTAPPTSSAAAAEPAPRREPDAGRGRRPVRAVSPRQPAPAASAAPNLQPVVEPGKPALLPVSAQDPPAPAPVAAPPESPVPDPAPPEPLRTWEELTVPEDSVVGLQLETPLTSETARVEDRVDARVTRDVRVDGKVAIPAGTHVIGAVTMVDQGGKIRERSRLGVRFHTLVLSDTSQVPFSTGTVYREGEPPSTRSTAKIGGGAIGGAILGAILGGSKGALIGSGVGAAGGTAATLAGDRKPVVMPVGTPISVRVQGPVTVTVEK